MKNYLKRIGITAIAFLILLCIVFIIRYFLNERDSELSLIQFVINSLNNGVFIAYFGFVLFYPFYSFGKKTRHLAKDYDYNKEAIEKLIASMGYIKFYEDPNTIKFKKEKFLSRLYYMFLDEIEINITDNPIVFHGQRRELIKINKVLDDALL